MAALRLRRGGAWNDLQNIKVRQGGTWVTPKSIYVRAYGAWQIAWSSLTAAITGGSVSFNLGTASRPVSRVMQVGVYVTASSAAPITYQWTVTAGFNVDNVSIANANVSGATVTASARLNQPGSVSLQCVVTSGGSTQVLNTSANFNYYNVI